MRDSLFTVEEQALLEDVLAVLKPLKRATLFVSYDSQPTFSRILPTLAKLNQEITINEHDSELVVKMKSNTRANLDKRCNDQAVRSFLLKATFLDPRYKALNNIAMEGAQYATKQAVRDMCILVVE